MKKLFITILGLPISYLMSCGNVESDGPIDSLSQKQTAEDWSFTRMHDTIQLLLTRATVEDSLEHYSATKLPFLYVKSGNIISKTKKNALVIYSASDTTVWVDFYEIRDHGWSKKEALLELPGPGYPFGVTFDDYNFDGVGDIFITHSFTNGYPATFGQLLISDSTGTYLTWHPEADWKGNLKIDWKNKTLMSDSIIWCDPKPLREACTLTNRWINGQLVTIQQDCPCK